LQALFITHYIDDKQYISKSCLTQLQGNITNKLYSWQCTYVYEQSSLYSLLLITTSHNWTVHC